MSTTHPFDGELLTAAQIAARSGLSDTTIRRYLARGADGMVAIRHCQDAAARNKSASARRGGQACKRLCASVPMLHRKSYLLRGE